MSNENTDPGNWIVNATDRELLNAFNKKIRGEPLDQEGIVNIRAELFLEEYYRRKNRRLNVTMTILTIVITFLTAVNVAIVAGVKL